MPKSKTNKHNAPQPDHTDPAAAMNPDSATEAAAEAVLPGQHPDVMPDFVFGHLAASAETTAELVLALSKVQHDYCIRPHLPRTGNLVTVQATTGPAVPATAVWLYYT